MSVVGKVGSFLSRSVYTVSGPFHPFGGAVDIIVVEQQDGSFKSSPWYVRFGKFQGVLKAKEKVVSISVNGAEADFHMYLDSKGEAYFLTEVDVGEGDTVPSPSSSGEDTDGQSHDRRVLKAKSCNFDTYESESITQIELGSGNLPLFSRSSYRRSRILGLVFGRKSFKRSNLPEEEDVLGVVRSESLERAEIAADLLDVKWSTNLDSPRQRKDNASRLSSHVNAEAIDCKILMTKDGDNNVDSIASDNNMPDRIVQSEISFSSGEEGCRLACIPMKSERSGVETGEGSEHVLVETVHTTGFVCEVSSIPSSDPNINESLITQELLENQSDGFFTLDEKTTSSSSKENGVLAEAYSQTITLQPVYASAEDIESRRMFTISTSQAVVEKTVCDEDESSKCEPSVKLVNYPIQLDFLASEISEEEQLLFGDFDDFNPSSVKTLEESVSPSYSGKEGVPPCLHVETEEVNESPILGSLPGLSKTESFQVKLPDDNCSRKLKTVSSHIDIPSTSMQSKEVSRIVRSLPNMIVHNNDLLGNVDKDEPSDIQPSKIEQMAKDTKSIEELKNEMNDPVIDATNGNIGTEDGVDLPSKKVSKKKTKSITPTSEQLASLNLKEGSNSIVFTFSTPMLGKQQVDCRIFLWKWDVTVVISDVDGTITRSDLLGQVMPLVGVDWSQTGVAHLFSAIKENGYQLLFLSARAISQASNTRQFLINLKQDGKVLPEGPIVISPDGLFPSLYREVVRRAPHEFKIACLEDIKALFPPDRNPFYAGFGNRDTDEISYLKVGIPRGKIFIINPKGEIVVNRRVDTKTYTSLHAVVHDMFPPMSSSEQEDYNSWNFWKLPTPILE